MLQVYISPIGCPVQNHSPPLKVALLFIVSCALWLTLFVMQGTRIASTLLPFLEWEISLIAPQYHLIKLDVKHQGGEAVFKANIITRHPLQIAGQDIPSGLPMECSTLVGHLWQPLILLLSAVCTAGLLRRTHLPLTLLLTIIAAGALIMIDVPFVLVGALEDMTLSVTSPSTEWHSAWVMWMNFLNGGGRLALGFAAALSVLSVSGMWVRKITAEASISHESGMDTAQLQRLRTR